MDKNEMWDKLLELGVSEETINVVTSINGFSEDTMEDILYAVTGYRDFGQLEYYHEEDRNGERFKHTGLGVYPSRYGFYGRPL